MSQNGGIKDTGEKEPEAATKADLMAPNELVDPPEPPMSDESKSTVADPSAPPEPIDPAKIADPETPSELVDPSESPVSDESIVSYPETSPESLKPTTKADSEASPELVGPSEPLESPRPVEIDPAASSEPPVEPHQPERPGEAESPETAQRKKATSRRELYEKEAGKKQDERTDEKIRELKERQITLYQVEIERFRDQRELFVAPPSFERVTHELSQSDRHQAILIVGDKKSGKQTYAIKVASWILDNKLKDIGRKTLWFYTDRKSDQTLLNMVYDSNLQNNSVVIIEEATQHGLLSDEMDLGPVDFGEILRARNIYLILTATVSHDKGYSFDSNDLIVGNTGGVDLVQVFRKHIDIIFDENFYPQEHEKLQEIFSDEKIKKAILERYNTPSKLSWFLRRLRNNPDVLWKEELIDKLKLLDTQIARAWFDSLTPLNYRLYAMMAALFARLEIQSLDPLYVDIVRFLRESEGLSAPEEFVDPRQIRIRELRTRTALRESGPVLEFEDDSFRQVVLEQVNNHYWLLWSIRSYLVEFIRFLRNPVDSRYQSYDDRRRVRDIIARTLATIGINYRLELRNLLAELVGHKEPFVVVTASSILSVLAETGQYDDFIVEVLEKWVHSKNYDQIWAACVTISRLYSIESGQRLSETTEVNSYQNAYLFDELDKCLTYISKNYRDLQYDREILRASLREELVELFGEPDKDASSDLEQALAQLVERQIKLTYNGIRIALVDAVGEIATSHPHRALQLLQSWLDSENVSHHYEHARMALNQIWNRSASTKSVFLERYAFPKMLFLEPALKASKGLTFGALSHFLFLVSEWGTFRADEREWHSRVAQLLEQEPILNAAEAMLKWYEAAVSGPLEQESEQINEVDAKKHFARGDELWEGVVHPQLMLLSTKITREERLLLTVAVLEKWGQVGNRQKAVLRVMHKLMTRSHVLNGELTLIPTAKRKGLVVVDGNSSLSNDSYFKPILHFIRTIGGMLPLSVYLLGDTRQHYIVQGSTIEREVGRPNVTLRELHAVGQPRPPLLMPIVRDQDQSVVHDEIVFLTVFNSRPILDIQDLLPVSPLESRDKPSVSPLELKWLKAQKETPKQKVTWEWTGRVFLSDLTGVSDAHHALVSKINRHLLGLQQHLFAIVARVQNHIPTQLLRSHLEEFTSSLPSEMSFELTVRKWLEIAQQNESLKTDIDVVQAIASAFVLEMKEGNLEQVCSVLGGWMNTNVETSTARAVSIAVTRILFSVAMSDPDFSLENVSTLMHLLPKFCATVTDYSEILPIFDRIIEWATSQEQINFLGQNEDLTKSLFSIDERSLQGLAAWFLRYDELLAFTEVFLSVDLSIDKFIQMLDEIREQYRSKSGQETIDQAGLEIADYLSHDKMKDLLLAFRTGLNKIDNDEVYYWLLLKLTQLQNPTIENGKDPKTIVTQLLRSASQMQQIVQQRLHGTVPQLEPGYFYGLIIVDAASQEALKLSQRLLAIFAKQCPTNLSLILHYLGNPTIVQQLSKLDSSSAIKDMEMNRSRPAVLGPALTKYTDHRDQIAFVLIITQLEIIDYDDWVEMDEAIWAYRFCVVTNESNWTPSRGELVNVSNDISITDLANRLFKRIEQ